MNILYNFNNLSNLNVMTLTVLNINQFSRDTFFRPIKFESIQKKLSLKT